VPGADDEAILADIVRSLGRDRDAVRNALAIPCEIAVGDFAGLDDAKAESAAMTLLGREGPAVVALGRAAVLQCYYRDDRVMRTLGLEPRPPYPKGRVLEQGDWSLRFGVVRPGQTDDAANRTTRSLANVGLERSPA
jgi:hypothetical protein